jgi:hypothetical protein
MAEQWKTGGSLWTMPCSRPHASYCFHHSKITTDRKRIFSTILYFIACRVLLLFPPTTAHIFFPPFLLFLLPAKHKNALYSTGENCLHFFTTFTYCSSLSSLCCSQIPVDLPFFHINFMTHHRASLRKSVSSNFVHVISNNDTFSIYCVFSTSD